MNKPKKIVIISAVFFPRNSPRANRTTELAKEFARQGHNVTVYAVLGKFDYKDFERKYNVRVNDFDKIKFARLNSDGESNSGILTKLFTKLFNKIIEFPDVELAFKIPKILKKEKNVDLLITIAVPYPIHWGAALYKSRVKNVFPKTWIADCGDPFMGNKFNKHYFYFKFIEKWFCRKADYITIPIEEAREGYYEEFHDKIKVIPQGFNFDDVILKNEEPTNEVVTFIYAGAFYKGIRDPELFLEYISTLQIDFKFIVYTKYKSIITPYLSILGDKIELKDYIPRKELLKVLSKADFLVNFENGTTIQSPSKLIDYAIVNRPILSVNSHNIEKETVNDFLVRKYDNQVKMENIDQYNIKNVVNDFLRLIKK
jgi:hypothetical protein